MSWFRRRKPQGEQPGPVAVIDGRHRSPGLAALSKELQGRQVESILDFGASCNENLRYMSRYSANIVIRDFASMTSGAASGLHPGPFEIDPEGLGNESGEHYDVVLLWDLLHYVDRGRLADLFARLAQSCRPGALVFLIASGSASIPLTPLRIKIHDHDHLDYEVGGPRRLAAPHFTPREIEQVMGGFRPVRFFQLRNGLQEFLFRYEPPEPEPEPEPKAESEPEPESEPGARSPDPKPKPNVPGDWYS